MIEKDKYERQMTQENFVSILDKVLSRIENHEIVNDEKVLLNKKKLLDMPFLNNPDKFSEQTNKEIDQQI